MQNLWSLPGHLTHGRKGTKGTGNEIKGWTVRMVVGRNSNRMAVE